MKNVTTRTLTIVGLQQRTKSNGKECVLISTEEGVLLHVSPKVILKCTSSLNAGEKYVFKYSTVVSPNPYNKKMMTFNNVVSMKMTNLDLQKDVEEEGQFPEMSKVDKIFTEF